MKNKTVACNCNWCGKVILAEKYKTNNAEYPETLCCTCYEEYLVTEDNDRETYFSYEE